MWVIAAEKGGELGALTLVEIQSIRGRFHHEGASSFNATSMPMANERRPLLCSAQ
jgi:hypothetical protein